jgi:hypothetical protein
MLNFCQALQLAFCRHKLIVVKHCPLFQTNVLPSGYDGRILRLVEHRNKFPTSTSSALHSFTTCCFRTQPKLPVLLREFIKNNGAYLPNYTVSLFIGPSSSYTYCGALHNCSKFVIALTITTDINKHNGLTIRKFNTCRYKNLKSPF